MIKCLAKDRNCEPCRNHGITNSRFCVFHQYMNEYTDEMLSKIQPCSGCKKAYYIADGGKTCESCRDRGKKNRASKEKPVLCSKKGCPSKRSQENIYCGRHQLCQFEDETLAMNKKVCKNCIRGCRSQLNMDYQHSNCEECLEKDREKDGNRRGFVKEQNRAVENISIVRLENNLETAPAGNLENTVETAPVGNLENTVETAPVGNLENTFETVSKNNLENNLYATKICNWCFKNLPIENFVGERQPITKNCKGCREKFKKNDEKRDKSHRNEIARKNEKKPERKEAKEKWKDENYEKVAKIWMNSRQKKIERLGTEEYLKQNAETAKKWRENNKEKVVQINECKKCCKKINFSNYIRNADIKNLEFSLTYENYISIVEKECYYCGVKQEKGFNGIDRLDQTKGYVFENCVSSCKMCNYMKGSLSDDVFIKRSEHILTFQQKIRGNVYPDCFANHMSGSYSSYKDRADKKGLLFTITPNEFESIKNRNCFMCGKNNSEFHKNGVDRMDSNMGYIIDNLKPCCAECNYMKKAFDFSELLNKFAMIYEKHKNDVFVNATNSTKIIVKTNKKTKQEIQENAMHRKKKQQEDLQERYADEEYKNKKAEEIAKSRKR